MPIVGRDWSHDGVAELFTKIKKAGYLILYLTARAIGQADATRDYLFGLTQQQTNKLPGTRRGLPFSLFGRKMAFVLCVSSSNMSGSVLEQGEGADKLTEKARAAVDRAGLVCVFLSLSRYVYMCLYGYTCVQVCIRMCKYLYNSYICACASCVDKTRRGGEW